MACTKCNSERLAEISGKCDDKCYYTAGAAYGNGYVPYDMGVGGGDYIKLKYCLDCGQIQGEFPLPKTDLETQADEDNEDED